MIRDRHHSCHNACAVRRHSRFGSLGQYMAKLFFSTNPQSRHLLALLRPVKALDAQKHASVKIFWDRVLATRLQSFLIKRDLIPLFRRLFLWNPLIVLKS